jgi:hypothetical protein
MSFALVLYWAGLLGALAALVVYFLQIAIRPKWVRLVSGSALLFTGIGLAETAVGLHALRPSDPQQLGAGIAVLALLAAVYLQAAAALRGRRAERREPVGETAPGAR